MHAVRQTLEKWPVEQTLMRIAATTIFGGTDNNHFAALVSNAYRALKVATNNGTQSVDLDAQSTFDAMRALGQILDIGAGLGERQRWEFSDLIDGPLSILGAALGYTERTDEHLPPEERLHMQNMVRHTCWRAWSNKDGDRAAICRELRAFRDLATLLDTIVGMAEERKILDFGDDPLFGECELFFEFPKKPPRGFEAFYRLTGLGAKLVALIDEFEGECVNAERIGRHNPEVMALLMQDEPLRQTLNGFAAELKQHPEDQDVHIRLWATLHSADLQFCADNLSDPEGLHPELIIRRDWSITKPEEAFNALEGKLYNSYGFSHCNPENFCDSDYWDIYIADKLDPAEDPAILGRLVTSIQQTLLFFRDAGTLVGDYNRSLSARDIVGLPYLSLNMAGLQEA